MKEKEDESAEEFAARVKLRVHNNAKKEMINIPEYKKLLTDGKYANTFSTHDLAWQARPIVDDPATDTSMQRIGAV